ncbi:MarR family winged helix-turn-helix transcriptional regulator [Streptomyces sp. ODS05-4]|uniref:MarR family winged helix-turn-helix transcriptional regulator n=1 Tax=Streptomyces sp. ODS05-4 TaxID=2944939 RepID=UPI00210D50B0|nr:MarR family transcriptional regulator [Streptomyces sp. ODS05-4]
MNDAMHPLSEEEEAAWRSLARLLTVLPRVLEVDLQKAARISMTEYAVLMSLSEAPDRQLGMSELAARAGVSPSRTSRIVDAFAEQGLITRSRSAGDGRSNVAALTDAGFARLRDAYPAHLASVRHRVVQHLDGVDLPALTAAFEAVDRAAGSRNR